MKKRNSIQALILFFAILFSFSLNAYNSINQAKKTIRVSHSTSIDLPVEQRLLTENLLFEELEDDNESGFSEAFLILPYFGLSFGMFNSAEKHFNKAGSFSSNSKPIFLSIRVLRI